MVVDVAERSETFDFDEATVTLPVPDGAEFGELDGLPDGERHLTWTAAPGALFMISAGADDAYTTPGEGARIASDAPAPLAGMGARRVVFRSTERRPRTLAEAAEGVRSLPERATEQLSDLLFVPGAGQHLRIGYRVDASTPEAVRAQLAHMLDRVEVRPHA
jgi:hypothetical protein